MSNEGCGFKKIVKLKNTIENHDFERLMFFKKRFFWKLQKLHCFETMCKNEITLNSVNFSTKINIFLIITFFCLKIKTQLHYSFEHVFRTNILEKMNIA